jgi:ribosomal protein S12
MANKKIKTKKENKKKQLKKAQEEIKEKMTMFDRMPDKCSVCKRDFVLNKTNVNAWKVQVYYENKKVLLYCPECDKVIEENVQKNIENYKKEENK